MMVLLPEIGAAEFPRDTFKGLSSKRRGGDHRGHDHQLRAETGPGWSTRLIQPLIRYVGTSFPAAWRVIFSGMNRGHLQRPCKNTGAAVLFSAGPSAWWPPTG